VATIEKPLRRKCGPLPNAFRGRLACASFDELDGVAERLLFVRALEATVGERCSRSGHSPQIGAADTLPPPMTRAESYLADLQREFPGLTLVRKEDVWHQRWADVLLRLATFGRMRTYASEYTTVLLRTIYVPSSWARRSDADRYVTLRHEAVHLRQARRYTPVGMALLYALPFFPVGLAYGRARIEWEAYAETLRAIAEVHGLEVARSPAQRARIVQQFTSAAYGWMWPFPATIERWIDAELERIAASIPR